MIIIGKPVHCDWPEFWDGWMETNLLLNGQKKKKYLEEIVSCINYRVCPHCGYEYSLIYEKQDDDDKFNCFHCSRIIKGENYNSKYTEVSIAIC